MTALSTRDALAKAIRAVTDLWDEPLDEVHDVPQIVNGLLASGAVVDVATLADDEALVAAAHEAINRADDEALTGSNFGVLGATYDEQARAVFRALAAALTDRAS